MPTFEQKYNTINKNSQERFKTDGTLLALQKKYRDYGQRLNKIRGQMEVRMSQIVQEEAKKVFGEK